MSLTDGIIAYLFIVRVTCSLCQWLECRLVENIIIIMLYVKFEGILFIYLYILSYSDWNIIFFSQNKKS